MTGTWCEVSTGGGSAGLRALFIRGTLRKQWRSGHGIEDSELHEGVLSPNPRARSMEGGVRGEY